MAKAMAPEPVPRSAMRNPEPWIHLKIERPESAPAEQIGQRLTALPGRQQIPESSLCLRIGNTVGMRKQPGPVLAERVRQQHLRFVA